MKKSVFLIAIILILSVSEVLVQKKLSAYKIEHPESLLYLPSGKYLKPLSLGYHLAAADLLWIRTISYFGGHFMTDKEYPWLSHILNIIIDLDPRFDFPYYFGGIVLSLEASQVENANKILERGMVAFPDRWQYPFYIGFNYFYHQGDAAKAAPYIEKAAALPKRPDFVQSLVGTLYAKSGKKEKALQFFKDAYNHTEDPLIKGKLREKILKIEAE